MIKHHPICLVMTIGLATVILPIASHAAKPAKKSVAAHKTDPNETFIRQAYAYQVSAVENLDVNKAFLYVASDYTEVMPSGQIIARETAIAQAYKLFQQMSQANAVINLSRKIVQINISQLTATVTVKSHFILQVPNQDESKLPHQMKLPGGITRDTWVRTQTGWAMQKSEILSTTN